MVNKFENRRKFIFIVFERCTGECPRPLSFEALESGTGVVSILYSLGFGLLRGELGLSVKSDLRVS